jgi:hypothetical protein
MPALLDVLFSMILGFTIILIIFNANMVVSEGWFMYNGEMMVQQMLISTATLIEGEFRNMGFGVEKDPTTGSGIVLYADATRFRFATALNPAFPDNINEVQYRLGPTSDVNYQNERIRPLYRSVDDGPELTVGMVTEFSLRYFNREGESLMVPMIEPGNIHLIEIEMEVQHPHALYRDPRDIQENQPDAFYATSRWRQTRLSSKNFQTR